MEAIERRAFMKGAGLGALAFTVGGVEVMLMPSEARAQGVPLRTLNAEQAATLDALGETLVPGAKQAGISDKTVASVRAELVARSEIPSVDERVDLGNAERRRENRAGIRHVA